MYCFQQNLICISVEWNLSLAVGYLAIVMVNHDIVWLDVPMHYAHAMTVI